MNEFGEAKNNRIRFFAELLTCGQNLYSWTYDQDFNIVFSNCPDSLAFNLIFLLDETRPSLIKELHSTGLPVVFTNFLGLMWIADFENDAAGNLMNIHVIGPAFYDEVSSQTLDKAIKRLNLSLSIKNQFLDILNELPIIPVVRFLQHGLMLHYVLTNEKISTSDMQHLSVPTNSTKELQADIQIHGTWAAEQNMLKQVEEGNLDYRKIHEKTAITGHVGKMSNGDPIRQVKNQIIVFTALCTRAAIKGGLAPETAYTLSDRYIQNVESCSTIAELAEVGRAMEDDFIHRVHHIKVQNGISPQIHKCCDYINLHVDEKITVKQLANVAGHAENYLIKKFKQETGKTISAYILSHKIEKAKILLLDTNDTVQTIAEHLGFATQSHFGEQFRKYTGMTPGEFRLNKK